jgi:hypothetical protein
LFCSPIGPLFWSSGVSFWQFIPLVDDDGKAGGITLGEKIPALTTIDFDPSTNQQWVSWQ